MSGKESIAGDIDLSSGKRDGEAGIKNAIEGTPIVGKGVTTVASSYENFKNADDVGEFAGAAGSLVADGAGFVAESAAEVTSFALDPVGWLVSNGLDFLLDLVQPLQDALHFVTGDGPSLSEASENFVLIGNGFVELADDFVTTADNALQEWTEEAGDAAREALADFAAGIQGIGSSAGSVAQTLKMWSMVMTVIEEVIKAIISEFVSWLIYIWLPAIAASIVSFGSSVAAAMTASLAKVASVFSKITAKLGKLGRLLDTFMAFLQKWSAKLIKSRGQLTKGQENAAVGALSGALAGKGKATLLAAGDVAQGAGKKVLEESVKELTGVKPDKPASGGHLAKSVFDVAGKANDHAETTRMGNIGDDQSPEETRRNLDL